MNYRHAFHAGNHGDCLKHALLVWLLGAMQRKDGGIFVLDTHAGIGRYDLAGEAAGRTSRADGDVVDRQLVRGVGFGWAVGREPDDRVGAEQLARRRHFLGLADAANELPVDYIAVGPIWETPTKPGRPAIGLDPVTHAAASSQRPFFAIGGIDPGNAEQVVAAGASRLCVVRAIRDAEDPAATAEALRRAFSAGGGEAWRRVAPGG